MLLPCPAGKDDGVKSDLVTADGLKSLSADKPMVVKTAKGMAVEASDEGGESGGGGGGSSLPFGRWCWEPLTGVCGQQGVGTDRTQWARHIVAGSRLLSWWV